MGIKTNNTRLILFSLLFLASGSTGLIYEIAWERILEQYFGVTMVSITLIVGAYMAGLGLGSLFGGRISQRASKPLQLYGLVELGIGLCGLASPYALSWIGRATAGSAYGVVFTLSFALLLIPTFLMGMTLPLLSQGFIVRLDNSGRIIGLLYGINTLGAAGGAFLTGYVLIGTAGLDGATRLAFLMNVIIGLSAAGLSRLRSSAQSPASRTAPQAPERPVSWGYGRILFASFLTGFLGLGYEMLWLRALSVINKNTAYHFPTVLGIFLFGLAIGGYVWGRQADRTDDPVRLFWRIEIGLALAAGACFLVLWWAVTQGPGAAWLRSVFFENQRPPPPFVYVDGQVNLYDRRLILGTLEYILPTLLAVLPAAIMMGGGLPVLDRIAIESPALAGRRIGDIHLANILGSVSGTLALSFLFLPILGTEHSLKVLVLASLAFPALYWTKSSARQKRPIRRQALDWIAVLPVLLLVLLPAKGEFYRTLFEAGSGARSIVHETGDSVLALSMDGSSTNPKYLWIGGETNSQFPSQGYYEAQAIACAGTSHLERVLVIGLGGGHTTHFITHIPEIREIVVVELLKDLAPFLEDRIPSVHFALTDARLRYIVDDGRRYLYANPAEKFDLIILDPIRKVTSGHDNLYSVEALRLYQDHLSEAGVLCLWTDDARLVPLSAASVFPEVDSFQELVVASNRPIRYDLPYMRTLAQSYLTSADAVLSPDSRDNISAYATLGTFLRDRPTILAQEATPVVLTDFRPWLEYYYLNPAGMPEPRRNMELGLAFFRRIDGCDAACIDILVQHYR